MARVIADEPVGTEQHLKMSYEEYLAFVDETTHSEWVDGEVTIFMPPAIRHQRLAFFLAMLIGMFVERKRLGFVVQEPVEMKLRAGRSYRQPDIVVILNEHADRVNEQRLDGPADVVVELVSPESVQRDRQEKLREYEIAGVPEYWIVDARPERFAIEMYTRDASGALGPIQPDAQDRFWSRVLAGLWLDPAWFADEAIPLATEVYRQIDPTYT